MTTVITEKIQLPLVRLSLAQPFVDASLIAGVDVDQVLIPYGVNTLAFSNPDIFLPSPTMYDVVEALGDAIGDPFIGVQLGAQLDIFKWSPFIQAATTSNSVGDLLLRFSIDAYKDANSVIFKLETHSNRTTFAEVRLTDGGRKPRHNDGFGAAIIIKILRSALGTAWEGSEVIVSVCDPSVFPAKYMGIRLAQHDTRGFSISFPCEWLLLEHGLERKTDKAPVAAFSSSTPASDLSALRHILLSNLHSPNLSTTRVADLCGLSPRTLNRRLASMGTSLKAELNNLRQKQAETELRETGRTIAQIGQSVGYRDPTVFSRAFRRWTGTTPKQFRQSIGR